MTLKQLNLVDCIITKNNNYVIIYHNIWAIQRITQKLKIIWYQMNLPNRRSSEIFFPSDWKYIYNLKSDHVSASRIRFELINSEFLFFENSLISDKMPIRHLQATSRKINWLTIFQSCVTLSQIICWQSIQTRLQTQWL